jgi:GH43 family beta-xylosidase
METMKSLVLSGLAIIVIVCSLLFYLNQKGEPAVLEDSNASTFNNPIYQLQGIPDPYVYLHTDGYYYMTGTTTTNSVELIRSASLTDMTNGVRKTIWTPSEVNLSRNVWAPEMHFINNKWYVYFTASDGEYKNQRMLVLENSSPDPLEDTWVYKGQVVGTSTQYGSIDGNIFENNGTMYFMWTDMEYGNKIYVASMSDPWTLSSEGVMISKAEHSWEFVNGNTNEGTAVLKRNGRIFVTYSANDCSVDDYAVGLLTALDTSDLLDPASWTKSSEPVFVRNDEENVFGPGHNSFTTSYDGTEDWIVYHGNSNANEGCNNTRMARAQKFEWNSDGTPQFGKPVTYGIQMPSGGEGSNALVANASFEKDGKPSSSIALWHSSGQNPEAAFTEEGGRSGRFRAVHQMKDAYEVRTEQVVNHLPNGRYTLKAWVQSSGGQKTANMSISGFNREGKTMEVSINKTPKGKWEQIIIEDILVTSNEIKIEFYSDADSGQFIRFDDIELVK